MRVHEFKEELDMQKRCNHVHMLVNTSTRSPTMAPHNIKTNIQRVASGTCATQIADVAVSSARM